MDFQFSPDEVGQIQSRLLTWYKQSRRKLPWRGDGDAEVEPIPCTPYGTLVSELMLQQTRVETVIPYWRRWMSRFPDVPSLAAATPDEVNALWAGLGYYARAQRLRKAAQYVMENCDGQIPSVVEDLLKIPGIGPYTAGAVSSIAFNKPSPLVDGNVVRVLSRLRAIPFEADSKAMGSLTWQLAGVLVHPDEPGDFNQALMELGATVCKPKEAVCASCPVETMCLARAAVRSECTEIESGGGVVREVTWYPCKSIKKAVPLVHLAVLVLKEQPSTPGQPVSYLLVRRPAKGLLARQWEFPNLEWSEETGSVTVSIFADLIESMFGLTLKGGLHEHREVLTVTHVFSHQKHVMQVVVADCQVSSGSVLVLPYDSRQSEPAEGERVADAGVDGSGDGDCTTGISSGTGIRESAWMTAEQLRSAGITTGCKKVLVCAEANETVSPAAKRQYPGTVRAGKKSKK